MKETGAFVVNGQHMHVNLMQWINMKYKTSKKAIDSQPLTVNIGKEKRRDIQLRC